ncbi:MAG: riboflavin synthase [Deltaproteobacteria bacterium]|nr:riboflavin synthase [Deltaproteobacteria bacterium]
MFTGLIADVGTIQRLVRGDRSTTLTVATTLTRDPFALGDSLSVNGACLTVVELGADAVDVTAVAETMERTNLGDLRVGDTVNLERPLQLGARLDGHLVQGHVDGVGRLAERSRAGDSEVLSFTYPEELEPFLVSKGSVAVDGVSLTVSGLGSGTFDISAIPHTLSETTLGSRSKGGRVNLEMDIIGKYVAKMLRAYGGDPGGITAAKLAEHGFL